MASTSRCQSEIELGYFFRELAPPVNSPLPDTKYDVFINHRGPDVKHTLAIPIYEAINCKTIRVFLDKEELNLGDHFPTVIEQTICSASVYIVIFSHGYAQSPWCLTELSLMLKLGKPIIPIFDHVELSDLKKVVEGKGLYANAFLEHEKKGRYSLEIIREWKKALSSTSYYMGAIINGDNDVERVLKDTRDRVLQIMKKPKVVLHVGTGNYPVGLEDVVADFEIIAGETQIVGICGMGGSGKTTLAKELFNQKYLCGKFRRYSFISEVKDENKLDENHRKLLEDLNIKKMNTTDLKSVPVLIVLDDVTHTHQLDVLLPRKGSLGQGSLIIVVTREKEVLKYWGISSVYKMKKMNRDHARELFCWHAFSHSIPPLDFEVLVKKILNVCDGLPLALKVYGSELRGRSDKDLWERQISQMLPNKIYSCLKVTYDNLSQEEKYMFLEVACYFNGKDLRMVIALWEEYGWSAQYCWKRLRDKCLVDLDDNDCIIMHAQLEAMGREIAKTQPPYRLRSPEQLTRIQKQEKGVIQIQGMMMNAATNDVHKFSTFLLNASMRLCGFRGTIRTTSEQLTGSFPVISKIFIVRGNYQNNLQSAKLSQELAWLSWTECPHSKLPSSLSIENLRVLELQNCPKLVGLWKDKEAPVHLRVLVIRDCPKLERIPKSLGYLNDLEKIVLEGCNYLRKVDIYGIGDLVNLRELIVSDCPELAALPCFDKFTSLQVFELRGSNKVQKIPGLENCTSLEKLKLNCKSWEEPGVESLEQLQRLRRAEFVAKNEAAIEPLIQAFQKKPEEVIICTKVPADALLLLNPSDFSNLCVLHFFVDTKISDRPRASLPSSNGNAMMFCLVINCVSPQMTLSIGMDYSTVCSTEVEKGKWIWKGVFTQHSTFLTGQNFYIQQKRTESHQEQTELISGGNKVEKGFLVTGEEHLIVKVFHDLFGTSRS